MYLPECLRLCLVASFTDAWIETRWIHRLKILLLSHLLQMRGLKQDVPCIGTVEK